MFLNWIQRELLGILLLFFAYTAHFTAPRSAARARSTVAKIVWSSSVFRAGSAFRFASTSTSKNFAPIFQQAIGRFLSFTTRGICHAFCRSFGPIFRTKTGLNRAMGAKTFGLTLGVVAYSTSGSRAGAVKATKSRTLKVRKSRAVQQTIGQEKAVRTIKPRLNAKIGRTGWFPVGVQSAIRVFSAMRLTTANTVYRRAEIGAAITLNLTGISV